HVDVEDQDLGAVPVDVAAGRIRVPGLGDHLDVGLALEHEAQGAADDGVVIRKNYGDRLGRFLPRFGHGRTLARPAGAGGTLRLPQLDARDYVLVGVGKGALNKRVSRPAVGRRVMLAALVAALLCAAIGLAPGGSEAKKRHAAKQKRPNIVLIMDDDQSVNLQQYLTKTNADIGAKG